MIVHVDQSDLIGWRGEEEGVVEGGGGLGDVVVELEEHGDAAVSEELELGVRFYGCEDRQRCVVEEGSHGGVI